MLQSKIEALKKTNRFRIRNLFSEDIADFASNDYLGLADSKKTLKATYKLLKKSNIYAPKASMMVNGYHKIHHDFEKRLCELNDFEDGLLFSSGFCANIGIIEALCRRGVTLFMDEEYHASGILGSRLSCGDVVFFEHNSPSSLKEKIATTNPKNALIAIEGVYSMIGDIADAEFANIASENNFYLLVDEAHSSGVIGKNLLGYFDYYSIEIEPNFIKLGTLGKAYGSSGAYALGSSELISFLENRSKPSIYSTAPSLFDTLQAHINVDKISRKKEKYRNRLYENITLASNVFQIELKTPILILQVDSSERLLLIRDELKSSGFLLGAIRPPTTKKPSLRIILRGDYHKCKEMIERVSDVYL
ncbi:MAG: aminotransferase class I/II-fold pyridoxal phosphate-dependent enzyme [Campylobacterales bacterium]